MVELEEKSGVTDSIGIHPPVSESCRYYSPDQSGRSIVGPSVIPKAPPRASQNGV